MFVKVDWNSAGVLYYHLAEPEFEYQASEAESKVYSTGVAQMLGFSFLANQSQRKSQEDRRVSQAKQNTWGVDWAQIDIGEGDRHTPLGSKYSEPGSSIVKRSPYNFRHKPVQGNCGPLSGQALVALSVHHRTTAVMLHSQNRSRNGTGGIP